MKIAVIGCGSIGKRHIRNLLSLGYDVIAWNHGEARRKASAIDFGIRVYENINELYEDGEPDAAYICTPSAMHIDDAIVAANAGCHLFIEKPLGVSIEGIKELENIVAANSLLTHVGSNLRFHFGPGKIKDLLNKDVLGKPLWANFWGGMHLPDWHPEEDYREMYSAKQSLGGGVVFDFIHELDIVHWYFGRPDRVAAILSTTGWLEIETEDLVDAIFKYDSNLQVNVHLDYLQKPFQRGLRVVGEKGWAEWDLNKKGVEVFLYKQNTSNFLAYPSDYDHNQMYIDQSKYFADCIRNGKPSVSNIIAGKESLILASRVKESSAQVRFS